MRLTNQFADPNKKNSNLPTKASCGGNNWNAEEAKSIDMDAKNYNPSHLETGEEFPAVRQFSVDPVDK